MKVSLEEREALYHHLVAERNALLDQSAALLKARDGLSIKEQRTAKALAKEAMALQARAKDMKNTIRQARYEMDRVERHTIWETAVLALWGQDGLTACRAQMRREKEIRDKEKGE